MTAAFLEAESVLADIDQAVRVAASRDPRSQLRAAWSALREQHAAATADYLELVSPPEGTRVRAQQYERATEALRTVTAAMRRFAEVNADPLERARATLRAATAGDHEARVAAHRSLSALENASPAVGRLRSVSLATEALDRALTVFEQSTDILDRQTAAAAVVAAARRLEQLLAEAPDFADRARRVIRSVETRRNAISTRSEQVPDTLSALRREFSAECSVDLQRNGILVDERLAEADAELATARSLLDAAPDQAIEQAEAAREDLAVAEQSVDAVLDRLRVLREVRADPQGAEQRVRFRLRDAQLFAVNHTLVDEWGSVLDAQADRIERAKRDLDRVHPDYWAYLTQLRAVDDRITEIVSRMRGQVAAR
ncbi:hypothetical protein IA539_05940 [Gordonia sp. zg691]|uniref:hypothetical protein n=1 Tax=Gordonia jinghuaiqii TaxID=2758710 RepID=UPI00166257A1|nr:hypothetical protein [Gordonia jinghuaiqii]MBD0860749.1 hypothetical protein [Gordonia jinghuaiqii]